MSTNAPRTAALFRLYVNNAISDAQYRELLDLLQVDTISDELETELKELWAQSADPSTAVPDAVWNDKLQQLLHAINTETDAPSPLVKKMPLYRVRWAAAAIVILLAGSAWLFFNRTPPPVQSTAHVDAKDRAKSRCTGYEQSGFGARQRHIHLPG